MPTQLITRNKRTTTKKGTSAKKRKRSRGILTTETLGSRTICDGKVVLFQRENSKRWQCRIRRHTGIWVDYSTKETDLKKAKKVAEERYRNILYRQEMKLIDVTRRFGDVAKVARKELLKESKDKGIRKYRDYVLVIDRYLIPLLGKYQCHNITRDVLREFSEKRRQMLGKVPSRSTVSTHNVALNHILRKAYELNYIDAMPKFIADGGRKKRRPSFSEEEYRALHNFMRKDLAASKKLLVAEGRNGLDTISQKSYEIRELLRDIVLILANTGIRTGNELLKVKWRNLEVITADGMESILFNLPHTKTMEKTGTRQCVGYESKRGKNDERYGCWKPLRRIAERFGDLKALDWEELFEVDEYIFRLPSTGEVVRQEALTKNFKTLLKRCPYKGRKDGLLRDNKDDERVLYSLRHTYATFRLMDGISFDFLSKQMGSSIQMLENHYEHVKVRKLANVFSGHDKRQQLTQDSKNADLRQQLEELKEQNAQLMKMLAGK